ncbi:CCR4-NOT transcription complex subunit 10-like [Oppia nitens]|uniref:CCR4-NOT transcription complex subunit 10-like n=1 Tax=Oppia nitens TaxID=1686743 RepID=UPI0023DAA9E7|nr:CCR4-NOT transcription complex subunit 10-like [Oppia nitens]
MDSIVSIPISDETGGQSLLAAVKDMEKDKDREVAIQAQVEYENGNNSLVLDLLETLGTNKAIQHNRLITQFANDQNVDTLLDGLITSEDMDVDQHVLIDYNRALVLAKYLHRYDEAIDLLEQRRNLFTNDSMFGFVDDKLAIKVCHLLVILYLERRKDPNKALPLLQTITDKSDSSSVPNNLQQLKAKCYLQLGSVKTAKRELKSVGGQTLLRSYLEFQRQNYKKAMKVFQTCTDSQNPLYVNNEALINFGLGKRNTAVFLMAKTLKSKPNPETLYNLAIFHLFTGNPDSAFDILYTLAPLYRKNPQLWLRLAESRLQKYRNLRKSVIIDNKTDFDLCRRKHDVVNEHIGEGIHRKLILSSSSQAVNSDSEALCFCRSSLTNALTLINFPNERNFLPSNPPTDSELNRLKISILLCLSYVNLTLYDYSLAAQHANDALKLSPLGYQKVLAHLYAGEALIYLDQISEAIGHFNPELFVNQSNTLTNNNNYNNNNNNNSNNTTNNNTEVDKIYTPQWFSGTSGKAVLLYNLSIAYTLRGEYDKASETLRQVGQVSDQNITGQVFMLAVYLQLQQGNVDCAKTLIKSQLPQYR